MSCSFSPLRGGWYRCNEGHGRVSQRALDAHRRRHFKRERLGSPSTDGSVRTETYLIPTEVKLPVTKGYVGDPIVDCPGCSFAVYVPAKNGECSRCGTRFEVERVRPPRTSRW